jgi:hypothetical protein
LARIDGRGLYWLAAGIIVVGFVAAAVWLVANSRIGGWDFRNNLWAPAYLLLQGESPYDLSGLYEVGNPVWLPMVIGAFFPLGLLPLSQAAMIWRLLNVGVMVGLVWMVAEQKRPSLILFALGVLAIALYPRTIAHIQLGQISLLAAFLYLLAVLLMQRQRLWLAALPVALALAKPQLGILAVMGLLIMVYRQQQAQGMIRFVLAIGGWCVLLTLPLFLLYPGWPADFVLALGRNPSWLQPSLFSLLPVWLGWWGWVVWAVLLVLVVGINGRIWWQQPGLMAMCWSLALTPLVSPYIWSWDFVLLFPLFVWSLFHWRHWQTRGLLIAGYLVNWALMIGVIFGTDGSDQHFWWGSWLLIAVIVAGSGWEQRLLAQT